MGLKEVKKELQSQTKDQLIKHIGELYKKYKPVKEYFDFYISCNEEEVINNVKKDLSKILAPRLYSNPDLRKTRALLNKAKKLGLSDKSKIEIYFHYTQCIYDNGLEFGYWNESMYGSVSSVMTEAKKLIEINSVQNEFKAELEKLQKFADKYGFWF